MEKTWLIRTIQNQILGPVSREKVVEFVQKGSLKPQDEICSGNGYWFRIEEKELLKRYLFDEEKQTFNPVSEVEPKIETDNKGQTAQTMVIDLNSVSLEPEDLASDEDPQKVEQKNIKYPTGNDLDYPDSPEDQDLELPQDDEIALELEDSDKK